jgi:hypothetical protein
MVALSKRHPYDVMPVYLLAVLHTFVCDNQKSAKLRPHVKLYRIVWINGNELHRVR